MTASEATRQIRSWPLWAQLVLAAMILVPGSFAAGLSATGIMGERTLAGDLATQEVRISRLEDHWMYTACMMAAIAEDRAGRDCEYLLPAETREMLRSMRHSQGERP